MTRILYVGTYTQSKPGEAHRSEGIYGYTCGPTTGKLARAFSADGGKNPSFLALHPNGRYLFAANELNKGEVSSYSVHDETGRLSFISSQETGGAAPCYVSMDAGGHWLFAANYSGGSLSVFPVDEGRLMAMADHVQHEGKGPNQQRQEKAHAHSVRVDPEGRFVLAADLGLDRLLVYQQDAHSGKLTFHSQLATRPGAGPRHFDFHPNGRYIYLANELDNTVTVCGWDSQAGVLAAIQSVSTLPEQFSGESIVADIHVHPEGRTLYVSNRGHDSLAVFDIDPLTGSLQLLEHHSTGGGWPRNFGIDPEGQFLYVANQYSDNLVCFKIDPVRGRLENIGEVASVPSPVCVRFLDL